jgi:hypothetical protein
VRPIAEVVAEFERYGFRLYLGQAGEIRVKRPKPEPPKEKVLPTLEEAYRRKKELADYLKRRDALWGEPCTPEEERRVKQAFARPGTFLVYDEQTGGMRWIC